MKTKHEILYDKALKAIEELFSDTSITQTETKMSLIALMDEIDIKLDCLPNT